MNKRLVKRTVNQRRSMMEFQHINQPDFDRERDGAVNDILKKITSHSPNGSLTKAAREGYNEGYKQALRDWSIWKDGSQLIGCMQYSIKDLIEDINQIKS